MKSLAQICIDMAEAGIRLQTGDDLPLHALHPAAVEGRQALQPEHTAAAPALRGPEQASASIAD